MAFELNASKSLGEGVNASEVFVRSAGNSAVFRRSGALSPLNIVTFILAASFILGLEGDVFMDQQGDFDGDGERSPSTTNSAGAICLRPWSVPKMCVRLLW